MVKTIYKLPCRVISRINIFKHTGSLTGIKLFVLHHLPIGEKIIYEKRINSGLHVTEFILFDASDCYIDSVEDIKRYLDLQRFEQFYLEVEGTNDEPCKVEITYAPVDEMIMYKYHKSIGGDYQGQFLSYKFGESVVNLNISLQSGEILNVYSQSTQILSTIITQHEIMNIFKNAEELANNEEEKQKRSIFNWFGTRGNSHSD